ncbi:BQ2448_7893 [Microbotryum intermedium]|uniref:BQ2448_7893 protein n=1 Tax=Microbotryum intermedium TaxID=269621 RepID=A0A238FSN6_9BASI|nr:BQ2448_7893 [Microbotryum intermedium]
MTVKHGHDWLEDAVRVVPEALISREVTLRDALFSLVGKVDGKSQCSRTTYRTKHNEPKRQRLFMNTIVKLAEQIVAATAKRIKLIFVFDNATCRPEAGVSSIGPLPALTPLSGIQNPKVQRAVAAARRRQAEQPARSTSTRKLALQGTVECPDYYLLEREYEEDGNTKDKDVPKAPKGVRERIKATTATDLRATSSSAEQPGGRHGVDRGFRDGSVYKMSTLTGTLDDVVREVLSGGESNQVPHRLRRPRVFVDAAWPLLGVDGSYEHR